MNGVRIPEFVFADNSGVELYG
ncbi:hypothetical protein A2U01_0103818, partial [Trifolium medium]|nr:hypothetical protein [Trifolium medium]